MTTTTSKNNWFYEQNNCSAHALRVFWPPLYDYDAKSPNATFFWELEQTNFLSLFLNLDKFLKNSTPGEISYIWQIERVQIDAIKFKRTEIYFLATEPRTPNKKKKKWNYIGKTTTLYVHHAFLYISFPSLHTTTWNFLISRFMEDGNTWQRFSFSFCELRYSPLEFNSWKNRRHLTN